MNPLQVWILYGYTIDALLLPYISCDFLLEGLDLLIKSVLKNVCAVSNVCRIDLIFD